MLKLIFNIINLFNLILYSNSELININEESILTLKYKNIQKFPSSIYLDKIRFRESSLLPNYEGLFSIGLKKGKYEISNDDNIYFNKIIEKGRIIKSNSKLKTKLIKKNKFIELEKINYYQNKNHKIKISTMLNLKKYHNKPGKYQIYILLNNNILFTKNSTSNVFTYLSEYINVPKGNNIITMKAISYDNIWCSCMEANDGFNYGRHLTSWIFKEKKNETLIRIQLNVNNKLNIITKYNINNHNNTKKYKQNIRIMQNNYKFNYYKLLANQY